MPKNSFKKFEAMTSTKNTVQKISTTNKTNHEFDKKNIAISTIPLSHQ